MGDEYLIYVFLLGLSVMFICMGISWTRQQKREKEKKTTLDNERRNRILALCEKLSVTVSPQTSSDEAEKILRNAALNKFHDNLEEFCASIDLHADGLKCMPNDSTESFTLGVCGASSKTFYYNIQFKNSMSTDEPLDFKDYFWAYINSNISEKANYRTYLTKIANKQLFLDSQALDYLGIEGTERLASFFPNLQYASIPLSDIKYFQMSGDIGYSTKTNISGGGVNMDGAFAGAVLAGGAGAIIGSRAGTEIKSTSETITHDKRKLTFVYEENGTVKSLNFMGKAAEFAWDAFNEMMPQKEYSYVSQNQAKTPETTESYVEELGKLKQLLDGSVITQEEFDAKKKQLLGL